MLTMLSLCALLKCVLVIMATSVLPTARSDANCWMVWGFQRTAALST
jgi:hypothetical protein